MIINYCDFQFELYSSYDDRKYDNKKIYEFRDKVSGCRAVFHMDIYKAKEIVLKLNNKEKIFGIKINFNKSAKGDYILHFNQCRRDNKKIIIFNNRILTDRYRLLNPMMIEERNIYFYEYNNNNNTSIYPIIFQYVNGESNIRTIIETEIMISRGKFISAISETIKKEFDNIEKSKFEDLKSLEYQVKAEYILNKITCDIRGKFINNIELKIVNDYSQKRKMINDLYEDYKLYCYEYMSNNNENNLFENKYESNLYFQLYESEVNFKKDTKDTLVTTMTFDELSSAFKQVLNIPQRANINEFIKLSIMISGLEGFNTIIGCKKTIADNFNKYKYELLYSEKAAALFISKFITGILRGRPMKENASTIYNTYITNIGMVKIGKNKFINFIQEKSI